jgi:hypothetical protein
LAFFEERKVFLESIDCSHSRLSERNDEIESQAAQQLIDRDLYNCLFYEAYHLLWFNKGDKSNIILT